MAKAQVIPSVLSYNRNGAFKIVKYKIVHEENEVLAIELQRANMQVLLCLAFKVSTKYDLWVWILPTEDQIRALTHICTELIPFYNVLNDKVKPQ